jgi:hypothetical protein
LQEKQQVIFSAGFGIRTGHVETARDARDHRAGAFAVRRIADVEGFFGLLDFSGSWNRRRQSDQTPGVVGDSKAWS